MAETFGEPEAESVAHTNPAGRDTFVVRIWSSDGSEGLLGQVQHIRSRKRASFATPQRLMSFIQDHLQRAEGD
jgi:hypothetical protein